MVDSSPPLYPRFIEPLIRQALADTPVVCILGPRQVGKTTTALTFDPGRPYISFDDSTLLRAAKHDPIGFVAGLPVQITLDEVQRIPELMPALKNSVDKQRTPGRFLLTGSANLLLLPGVQESLAGRVEVIHMYPLSEQEKNRKKRGLLENIISGTVEPRITGEQSIVEGIPEIICAGGYPEPLTRQPNRARQWHRQYVKAIIQRDVKDIAAIRDGDELERLMQILAFRTSTLLNINGLSNELGMRRETTEKYLTILERLFLVRRLPAWHRNDAKRLVKTPKVHLIDSGLAATMGGRKPTDWSDYSIDFGPLLETFVVQQLICQSAWVDPELRFSHYRDKDKVEVDLVIERGKEVWGVEVKKSSSLGAKDARGLSHLAKLTGRQFKGGVLLYSGSNCLPLEQDHCFAVPLDALWR